MNTIEVAICDDNKIICEEIKAYIKDYFYPLHLNFNITIYNDGKYLLKSNKTFDIVILDIEMKYIDGITVKEEFFKERNNSKIIFLTDYDKYMTTAFGKNVYGFVRKENIGNLKSKLNVIINEYKEHQILSIHNEDIDISTIIYIEADSSYSRIKISNDDEIIVRDTLRIIEERLADHKMFLRIHRSYIINLKWVRKITSDKVYMQDGTQLTISRSYHDIVHQKYVKYLRDKVKNG